MGGMSVEREVSLRSGDAVSASLTRLGYHQIPIIVDSEVAFTLRREEIDIAFIALHGRYGEDGSIQGLLEIMQIPYTGSKVRASALAMNKVTSHTLLKAHHLPTLPVSILEEHEAPHFRSNELPFDLPAVVKPASEGSSVGVSIVQTGNEFKAAFKEAFQYGPKILIEKYISGMEVHVGILNNAPIGAIEVKPKGVFYDYTAKYVSGMSCHIFPAPLPKKLYQSVLNLGLKAHHALECCGYSRVDLLLDQGEYPYILEVNTLPGMTETSLMPEMARKSGIDFDTLIEQILETAKLENREA